MVVEIFADGELIAATAAQNCARIELRVRPDHGGVMRELCVAFVTRKPFSAAFELDRDYVALAVVMRTARFPINVCADDVDVVNLDLQCGRGLSAPTTGFQLFPCLAYLEIVALRLLPHFFSRAE